MIEKIYVATDSVLVKNNLKEITNNVVITKPEHISGTDRVYEAAKKLEGVDTSNIAIMGYCFGGLVSLDLARSGVDLKGAVSFHGFLSGSEDLEDKDISAKLLVLHGHLDPMVGQDQIDSFSEEMNKKSVDWQLHSFGNAMHAFTNPDANDPSFGTVYSQDADQRSWKIFKDFLSEIFS